VATDAGVAGSGNGRCPDGATLARSLQRQRGGAQRWSKGGAVDPMKAIPDPVAATLASGGRRTGDDWRPWGGMG
jgi:hypothetical protein